MGVNHVKPTAPRQVDMNSNEKDPSNHLVEDTTLSARERSPRYERRIKTGESTWRDAQISPSVGASEDTRDEIVKEVVMTKGGVGLGFCIEGGTASPLGDRPITVKRLFKGTHKTAFFICQLVVERMMDLRTTDAIFKISPKLGSIFSQARV